MLSSNIIAKKLLTEESIKMEDLVGVHRLAGAERHTLASSYSDYDRTSAITFVLDGIPFTFVEDPIDGYRSMLDRVEVGNYVVNNVFEPIMINIVMEEDEKFIGLCFYLDEKEKVEENKIAEIGTNYFDDYYPCFVDEWRPERIGVRI